LFLAVAPGWGREATDRAVGDSDFIFPRQSILTGDQVVHETVGAVRGSALHRDVAAMTQLIDVVFDAPVHTSLAHEVGSQLRRDDFVSKAVAFHKYDTVEV